jgi:ATP-dependent RNA helicase HelY
MRKRGRERYKFPKLTQETLKKARQRFLEGVGKPEAEFRIDDFQREAILSVTSFNDTLVTAPTGSGKTFIAISAMEIFLSLGHKCIYTTPLKALSNTKFAEFKEEFLDVKVGLLTGDRKIDTEADLLIATTEIFRNELLKGVARYSLVVLDEVHFIADPQRGAVWEEAIILAPKSSTLLMLSATVPNYSQFSRWVSQVRQKPCRVIVETNRPVPLRFGILDPVIGVAPLSIFR